MRAKDVVGRLGEQVAAEHLEAAGLRILSRNWRCRDGELDIIARDGSVLVFAEVKTRSSLAFGSPVEAVNPVKAARIRRLAGQWIDAERDHAQPEFWSAVRFDVVSVVRNSAGFDVSHFVGAF
jgi:putative endonuclease